MTYFWGGGGPRFVTVCDRGGGVKNHQKKRDILYGRPLNYEFINLDVFFNLLSMHVMTN